MKSTKKQRSRPRQRARGDFRLHRAKLPRSAFAIAVGREKKPPDPIDKKTWSSITNLPDDVSLRTSDFHGTAVREAHELWGHWVALCLDLRSVIESSADDPIYEVSLTFGDELQASLYAVLTGFYRQAIAGLRSGLEGMMAGALFRAYPDPAEFKGWADGTGDKLWWSNMRKRLAKVAPYAQFEGSGQRLDHLMADGGWVNYLYQRLSAFSHGRPQHVDEFGRWMPTANVYLWGGSNGPIYEPEAFRLWTAYYTGVALTALFLVGLSEPRVVSIATPTEVAYRELLLRVAATESLKMIPVVGRVVRYLLAPESRVDK